MKVLKSADYHDFSVSLSKRWKDLSPEIADASAKEAVWLRVDGASGPIKWLRPISMIEAKRVGATKWAKHFVTDGLSKRELDVFVSLATGKTVSETAKELFLSVKSVSTYRTRLIEKTGLRNNVEIAMYAFRVGMVDWPREVEYTGAVA